MYARVSPVPGRAPRKEYAYRIQREHGDISKAARTMLESEEVFELEEHGFRLYRAQPIIREQESLCAALQQDDPPYTCAFVEFTNHEKKTFYLLFVRSNEDEKTPKPLDVRTTPITPTVTHNPFDLLSNE